MKKIVLACGAGAATSTLVAQKVATLLDANGYADKYEIVQCAISEAKDACDEGADLLIATHRSAQHRVNLQPGCAGDKVTGGAGCIEFVLGQQRLVALNPFHQHIFTVIVSNQRDMFACG